MAKSRKKKDQNTRKSKQAAAKTVASEQKPVQKSHAEAAAVSDREAVKKEAARQSAPAGVRLSTCIAGMFLTLCLGLYLGSLLPDMLRAKPSGSQLHMPAGKALEAETQKPAMPAPNLIPEDVEPNKAVPSRLQAHIRHLEEDLKKNPASAKLLADLGNAYFDTGETGKAIEAYEKSLALEPVNPDVLTDLGIMYRENGNYDKALECFRKAVAINPGHLNALFNQGVVLGVDLRRHAEAKAVWQKLLEMSPDARTPDGKKVSEIIRQFDQSMQN